jgi:hypothetical protein
MTLLVRNRRKIGLAVAGVAVLAVASGAWAGERRFQRADFDAAKVKRLTLGDLSVAVPAAWRRVKPPAGVGAGVLVFMAAPGRGPVNAVTFSVASRKNPNGNTLSAGLQVRHALQGESAFSDLRGRLVHLSGVTAYVIRYVYRDGGDVFRGVKYVIGKPSVANVITYEALLKDSAVVAGAFDRSAGSLRWLRGPYDDLDIRSISVTRTRGNVLEFAVRFRHPTSLTKRTALQLLLDTDENARTGIQAAEYALDYDGSLRSAALLKAVGRHVHSSTPPTLTLKTTSSSATFRINARYVGHPATFGFWAFASTGRLPDDVAPSDNVDSALIAHGPPTKEWQFPKGKAPRRSRTFYGRLTYNNP